jgi:hypothetical protein
MRTEVIIPIIIYFVVPFLAFLLLIGLIWKMMAESIEKPPIIALSISLMNYSVLLILGLTSIFWKWSGMASIGSAYQFTLAPILMAFVSYRYYKKKELSFYHLLSYRSGIFYFLAIPVLFGLIYVFK